MMQRRGFGDISIPRIESAFSNTLTDDPLLISAIQQAFFAIHQQEGRLARNQGLDNLMTLLSRHIIQKPQSLLSHSPRQIEKLRDYLHENIASYIGLDKLSHQLDIELARVADRVGFSDQSHMGRWFQRAYRLSPAAYQRRCTNILD